jgi:predicted transposase YdaD
LRGGGEPAVIQRAVQLLRADTQLNELEPLLAFFASFVLDVPIVQQIMRWDMAILRESPWYQDIFTEGEKIGVQLGEKSGVKRQLVRILQRRFGEIPQDVQILFEGKSVEQLDSLMDAAITVASLEEFIAIVPG